MTGQARKMYTIKAHGSERGVRSFPTLERAIEELLKGYRMQHRYSMTGVELLGPDIHVAVGELDEAVRP